MFKFIAPISCLILQAMLTFSYVSKCVHPGAKCSDCENLIYCVNNVKGFNTYHLSYCNNSQGWFCSSHYGGCTNDSKVCKIFGLQNMECQMKGVFPDPYDCTTYHTCILTSAGDYVSVKGTCSDDRAFDPLTASCRFQPDHEVCKQGPVPKCKRPLQSQPLRENKNLFYICVRQGDDLVPWLYKCQAGEVYLAKNQTCVQSEEYSYLGCVGTGLFADPHDGTKYYDCRKQKFINHLSCPQNSYFNQEFEECIPIDQ